MRSASTYRGARRNAYVSPAKGTRFFGWNAWESANAKADLGMRSHQANSAREAASKALVAAGSLAGPAVVNYAFLDFYSREKRTRVVNRIISTLVKALPAIRTPMRQRAA
jgi:hypothetical protein